MKYLSEFGFHPDAIYGTSVGALNAVGYAYQGISGLEKVWRNIKGKTNIISFNWLSLILKSKGLYNTKPLRKILEKNIVGSPTCDIYVCKVSLITGKIKYGHDSEIDFISSVEASATIPGIMAPIDDEWVDGGVREQTPLKQAILDGTDKMIVILCNPLEYEQSERKVGNWISNALRTIDILTHEIFINDIQTCLECNKEKDKKFIELAVYAPSYIMHDTLDFDSEKIANGIQLGYETAIKGPIITTSLGTK